MTRDDCNVENLFERIATALAGLGLQEIENLGATRENQIMEAQDDAGTLLH
jgi:hypothetical protein